MASASSIFGELTFNKKAMREKLSNIVYNKLIASIESGEQLDQSIAADIAHAMKEWAIERGATHFTHWFQPQRGGTAEKHDAFISYDKNGEIIEKFSANQLIQSEPDASSFPSGGMRSTFEARGYTAWDPTSCAFLLELENTKTLVIPSVFLSWTGDVLDIKTPMLRSQKALNDAVLKIQHLLGNKTPKRIYVCLGPEQEYFLVSRKFFDTRPDLQICGRTLFGAEPAKGQQMEDHYFGAIKSKVLRFMEELDFELYRRGIPAKTRHNETSPNQFEIAPLYEISNLAVDHNLLLMDILKRVAEKYDMVALLNEKPFAGVNGSGKHVNWSLHDDTGENYLIPSDSPLKNINFLMTIAAILSGMNRFGGLLRTAVSDAGNDNRLGANEAPPAIMSVYLGEYLSSLLDEIEGIGTINDKNIAHINLGLKNLPRIAKDSSDRNRTSPLAYTGNKLEFRAVGSSQNIAEAVTVFNLITAKGFDIIHEKLSKTEVNLRSKSILILKDILKETKRIRFEGNNYSDDWQKEAEKRDLPNIKNTPEALNLFRKDDVVKLYEGYNILNRKELESKADIKLEAYVKIKEIEYKTAVDMSLTLILPAIARHITATAEAFNSMASSGVASKTLFNEVKELESLYTDIKTNADKLTRILIDCRKLDDLHSKAVYYAEKGEKRLALLRKFVDRSESIVAHDLWPMAKYQDMLNNL